MDNVKIAQWSLYLRMIFENNNIVFIAPKHLINIALSKPEGKALYTTEAEAIEFINKTIDHIKTNEDYFFSYDEENDLIMKKDVKEFP